MSDIVEVLIPPLAQPFTYELSAELQGRNLVGFHANVPFGKRSALGYIIKQCPRSEGSIPDGVTIKQLLKLDGSYRHFDPQQLNFFEWVADYYGDTISRVLEVAIPPAVPQKFERFLSLVTPAPTPSRPPGKLQSRILDLLKEHKEALPYPLVLRTLRGAATAVKQLAAAGLLHIESREFLDSHASPLAAAAWAKTEVSLNPSQIEALRQTNEALERSQFTPFLLHGVTGSGKTEVYIEAVQNALRQQKGALIIVPEIALTPQLIDRFRARLGSQIAVLHSGLHKRVRWDSWRALLEGRNCVAIGARSAIFAPVPRLGLIIVDEEHDGSYKQSEGLRYHARDLALVRGRMESCPVILGSATPSLESYYNAMRKKYTYLRLPSSHSTAAPSQLEIVDLNLIKPWEMKAKNLSPRLYEALATTVARGEQAFILYNRRGFATYLQCDRCEEVLKCPNCSVTLTYHQDNNALLCHYCSYSLIPPHFCSHCETGADRAPDSTKRTGAKAKDEAQGIYVQRGAGTERIFDEIKNLFPETPIDRLDRDTALDTESYRRILDRVRSGETKILIGTQMIAKGHDLPGVTLVGIADCDVGLHLPDFRASERIFQLLTQAAGRAGRADKPGTVILQTRVPLHPSLLKTVEKDYEGFARQELRSRKGLLYPPYARMLRVIVSSPERTYPERILASFKEHAMHATTTQKLSVSALGPAPAQLERLKAQWRWHLLFKSPSVSALHKILATLAALKIHTGKVRITFDLDPQEML